MSDLLTGETIQRNNATIGGSIDAKDASVKFDRVQVFQEEPMEAR